jgi:2-polyprenyl-3-methyl-5-hydroxy-6-metoxy-1,4-benzoquinol methylase
MGRITLASFDNVGSPDAHGTGLINGPLNPLRYEGHSDDPHEVAGILRALMPDKVCVLDVGCGTGSVTAIANRDKHNRVLGIEPDNNRVEIALSRGIDATCGFLDESFIKAKGPFDVIVFSDVLEHVVSPDAMLKLAVEGLKPGGILLASVPNVAHWSLRLNLLFGRFNYTDTGLCDATHLRWFTQRSVKALIRNQGLDILAVRHTAGLSLSVYSSPYFRIIPGPVLRKSIYALTRLFPRFFACQFVVKARKPWR